MELTPPRLMASLCACVCVCVHLFNLSIYYLLLKHTRTHIQTHQPIHEVYVHKACVMAAQVYKPQASINIYIYTLSIVN